MLHLNQAAFHIIAPPPQPKYWEGVGGYNEKDHRIAARKFEQ